MFSLYLHISIIIYTSYLHLITYTYLNLLIYNYVLFILLYDFVKVVKICGMQKLRRNFLDLKVFLLLEIIILLHFSNLCVFVSLYEPFAGIRTIHPRGKLPPGQGCSLTGIQTITPRGKLPHGQGWSLGQGQGQFQGWGATRQLHPRKIVPRLGLGFGLGLVLGLGRLDIGFQEV